METIDFSEDDRKLYARVLLLGWEIKREEGRFLIRPPKHICDRVPRLVWGEFLDFGFITMGEVHAFTESSEEMPTEWRAAADPVPTLRTFIAPVEVKPLPDDNRVRIDRLRLFHDTVTPLDPVLAEVYRETVEVLADYEALIDDKTPSGK